MALPIGIRGANPIWSEVDLQGQLFDDTFYLFVLENTIPYIPATVYHDDGLNQPWTGAIQFLGNGTLPIDIFYEPGVVYRLEFRQGPTQADPLIYEVDDYVPGNGSSIPIGNVAFASSNQVTNPQFALINFASPFTLSGTDPAPIHIAPGWFLNLAGTGTVTLTQVPLNNTNPNPSNAPYALEINISGWTDGSVLLTQRFQQNGMLWANKIVSSTITARVQGAPQGITANLVDSNAATLTNVLIASVDEDFNEFTGHGSLPATTNTDTPPAAYIEYQLSLPSNIDISVTSIQLVVEDMPVEPAFEQDSINRQIDHTYNTAYPIVPVGTVIDFAGFAVPQHYYACIGTAISRSTNNLLFQALTTVETVTLTSTSNTFTVVSSANYRIGMAVEGVGIPASTAISNVSGTTITISNAATASGAHAVTFFAWGNGDGSTTFNLPDLRDYVTAGVGGTIVATANNAPGATTGASTHAVTIAEMPLHDHSNGGGSFVPLAQGTAAVGGITALTNVSSSNTTVTVAAQGGGVLNVHGDPMPIVQQTALLMKCIRFE